MNIPARLLLLFPSTAHAHITVQGMDEIGSGALHPLMTPSHLLVLLGLGLFLGQQVPFRLKRPSLALAVTSAVALALTMTGKFPGVYQPVLIGIALIVAILVAVEQQVPPAITAGLCAAVALAIGLDSAMETGTTLAICKTLLGTWITVNVAVPYIAIVASNGADKQWAKIGIRIGGSWIIAISLMVLAFALKK